MARSMSDKKNNKMSKKEYIKPQAIAMDIHLESLLASLSGEETEDNTGGGEKSLEQGEPGEDTAKGNLGDNTTWDAWE